MRVLAAAAIALALAAPASAAGHTPGWKLLIKDWYDGQIDGVYRCSTYTAALRHLPTHGPTYSSAHDDLERARRDRGCVAADTTTTRARATRDEGRNYFADGVAAVLGIVAVVLVVRRRRQLQG